MATQNSAVPDQPAAQPAPSLMTRVAAVSVLAGFCAGLLVSALYCAHEYGALDYAKSTALTVYENPTLSVGWVAGSYQTLRSVWAYACRVLKPWLVAGFFRAYCALLSAISSVGCVARSSATLYQWLFMAHFAYDLGYAEVRKYRGLIAAPFDISFDPLAGAVVSDPWACFSEHSCGTINLRRQATNCPKRVGAFWSIDGDSMRLIGLGYIGDGVVATAAHVVRGNGGIVHHLKLGVTVAFSTSHLRVGKGTSVVPLPKALCEALISGRDEAWFARPPLRSDGSYHPGDDHAVLRFPNINSMLGVKVARTAYAGGKGTFVPVKAFEYVFDEVDESYVLYEQVGRVYDQQPCPGTLALSITSAPGMSGSMLFDPITESIIGMNIGSSALADGATVSIAICIRQIYVYWSQVEPCLNPSTFSWPKLRPTHTVHSNSTEESYYEIDEYEWRAEVEGYGDDFNAGDWETREERERREHLERDSADMLRSGTRGVDYSVIGGSIVHHCADSATHHLPSSGRLCGFTKVGPGVGTCFCCGVTVAAALCAGCSAMLNLQHKEWLVAPTLPDGFVPLTVFERSLVATVVTCEPKVFANDAVGSPFLFEVGKSTYKRRYNPGGDCRIPPADLLDALNISETYYVPDRSAAGVRSSLKANVEKRLVGNFGESSEHWVTFLEPTANPDSHFPVDLPELSSDLLASVRVEIYKHAQNMKLDKSAGWTGALLGCTSKGDLLAKHKADVLETAARRVVRFLLFPEFAASLGPVDLVLLGFRGVVIPEIKGELHAARKVIDPATGEKLANPRWRSILMQDTADHLVHMFFEHGFNTGLIANYQHGDIEDSVIPYGSLVGLATNAEGIARMHSVLAGLSGDYSQLRTSDVSGMDWCIGASDVMAAAAVRAQRILHSEHPYRKRLALGTYVASIAEARSVYLVEESLYAANETGVCQSGAFSTSEIDGFARVADARLRDMACDAIAYGDDCVRTMNTPTVWTDCFGRLGVTFAPVEDAEPVPEGYDQAYISSSGFFSFPGYVSALDERDVVPSLDYERGDTVNVCSRDFSVLNKTEFQLTSWPRCLTRLAAITDPDSFAESAGGLLVECRYTPEALAGIQRIAEYRGFPMPCASSTHNVDQYMS